MHDRGRILLLGQVTPRTNRSASASQTKQSRLALKAIHSSAQEPFPSFSAPLSPLAVAHSDVLSFLPWSRTASTEKLSAPPDLALRCELFHTGVGHGWREALLDERDNGWVGKSMLVAAWQSAGPALGVSTFSHRRWG